MPYVSQLYFKTAVVFFILGVAAGLQMAISGHHTVIGAHAHINLLGWVTSALFGAYYALNPAKAQLRTAMIQYGVYVAGVALLGASLYFMLLGNPSLEPIAAVASVIVFVGVLLFAVVVYSRDPDPAAANASLALARE